MLTLILLFAMVISQERKVIFVKNTKDSLGNRMKSNYENRTKTYLARRSSVILRL